MPATSTSWKPTTNATNLKAAVFIFLGGATPGDVRVGDLLDFAETGLASCRRSFDICYLSNSR